MYIFRLILLFAVIVFTVHAETSDPWKSQEKPIVGYVQFQPVNELGKKVASVKEELWSLDGMEFDFGRLLNIVPLSKKQRSAIQLIVDEYTNLQEGGEDDQFYIILFDAFDEGMIELPLVIISKAKLTSQLLQKAEDQGMYTTKRKSWTLISSSPEALEWMTDPQKIHDIRIQETQADIDIRLRPTAIKDHNDDLKLLLLITSGADLSDPEDPTVGLVKNGMDVLSAHSENLESLYIQLNVEIDGVHLTYGVQAKPDTPEALLFSNLPTEATMKPFFSIDAGLLQLQSHMNPSALVKYVNTLDEEVKAGMLDLHKPALDRMIKINDNAINILTGNTSILLDSENDSIIRKFIYEIKSSPEEALDFFASTVGPESGYIDVYNWFGRLASTNYLFQYDSKVSEYKGHRVDRLTTQAHMNAKSAQSNLDDYTSIVGMAEGTTVVENVYITAIPNYLFVANTEASLHALVDSAAVSEDYMVTETIDENTFLSGHIPLTISGGNELSGVKMGVPIIGEAKGEAADVSFIISYAMMDQFIEFANEYFPFLQPHVE